MQIRIRSLLTCISIGLLQTASAAASVYSGPGMVGGVGEAAQIQGPIHQPLRVVILRILLHALNFVAFAATVVVIIAGIYLVVGMGTEDSRTKAKTIIQYTALGIVVILLARAGVSFFTEVLPSA